jgi:hypothetical protein
LIGFLIEEPERFFVKIILIPNNEIGVVGAIAGIVLEMWFGGTRDWANLCFRSLRNQCGRNGCKEI